MPNPKYPTLIKWNVEYDPVFEFPITVHATVVGSTNPKFRNGARIYIDTIESIDFLNNLLVAGDLTNTKFNLAGPGKRLMSIDEDEFQALANFEENS